MTGMTRDDKEKLKNCNEYGWLTMTEMTRDDYGLLGMTRMTRDE